MMLCRLPIFRKLFLSRLFLSRPFLRRLFLAQTLCVLLPSVCAAAEPSTAAVAAFNTCASSIESRLARQHQSPESFLASSTPQTQARLRSGGVIVERLTPSTGAALPGAALYHWRGTAFAPGATAPDFERLMKDFNSYPQHFSPQVLQARVLTQNGDRLQATMRLRQQHILTVVLDTTYEIAFGHLDATHGYSISRSTRIAEIAAPGTPAERVLGASEDHGFLWRQNTYWSYEERDGGLYMQVESISLTRSIPTGLGWAIGPYVESIPRDSLEFTLRATCNALREQRRITQ
jgi:hypothetical protein